MKAKYYQKNMCIVKYKKIKSIHYGVGKCINYVTNPEKTMEGSLDMEFALNYAGNEDKVVEDRSGRKLVSGHNCNDANAIYEFNELEKNYHKNKSEYLNKGHTANNAFHIIISYKGHEIDPEEVHEMGREFALRLCGDEYKALVATHLNTENIHNHVVVCAYGMDGKPKLVERKKEYMLFREIAHDISLEHGYPILSEEIIDRPVSKKERERRKSVTKEVERMRREYPDYTRYKSVFVSAYDEYGRHRNGLERMFITIKEMMKQGSEAGYREAIRELDRDNIFFKPLSERLELIEEAEEICRRYEIGSIEQLDEKLRQLHAENSPYKQRINSLETYLSNAERFGDDARNMPEAELCPMQPKTKSDLFKAIHDSEYFLMKKFTDISEDEGKEIIKAIRNNKTEDLPSGLSFGRVYYGKEEEVHIKTREEWDREIEAKKQMLEEELKLQKPIKEKISELYKVKKNMEKYIRPEYVFGPLYSSDISPLNNTLKYLKDDITAEKRLYHEKGNINKHSL